MDACRGHSLIGSHHFFFQEKTSFPNSPPVEYFGFSLRKWKCSYSNLGNSSFPQIKKKREFFPKFSLFQYIFKLSYVLFPLSGGYPSILSEAGGRFS